MKDLLSRRVKDIDFSGIRTIFRVAGAAKDAIKFNLGNLDFETPIQLTTEVAHTVFQGKCSYTPSRGITPLVNAIKQEMIQDDFPEGDAIVTAGASGALACAFLALLDEGDEVILADPYFVAYKQLTKLCQAKPIFAKSDFSDLSSKITSKTKLIVVNSPGNPSGKLLTTNQMQHIVDVASQFNTTIIADEAYRKYIFEKDIQSIGTMYNQVITIITYSKELNISGWRVGAAYGPEQIISAMEKVQQFLYVCAPGPFQYALTEKRDFNRTLILNELKEKRDLAYNMITQEFTTEKSEGGFFLWVESPYDTDEFCKDAMEKGVFIIPGKVFSEKNTHFRMSYVIDKENIAKGVEILCELARNKKRKNLSELNIV